MISSLFSLAKAAQESSNATIDFFNSISDAQGVSAGHLVNVLNSIGTAGAEIAKATALSETMGVDTKVVNGKRKRAQKAPVDPNAPKRPSTAYFLYMAEARRIIKEEREKKNEAPLGNLEMTNEISKRWHALSEDAKNPWKKLYQKKLAEYNSEKQEYEDKRVTGDKAEPTLPVESEKHEEDNYEEPIHDSDEGPVDSSPSKTPKKKKREIEKEDKPKKEKKKDKKKRKSDIGL